jgi:hypothetical protein
MDLLIQYIDQKNLWTLDMQEQGPVQVLKVRSHMQVQRLVDLLPVAGIHDSTGQPGALAE